MKRMASLEEAVDGSLEAKGELRRSVSACSNDLWKLADDDDELVKLFVSEEWLKRKSKRKLKNELQAKVADDAARNLTCCCRAEPSIKMSGARTSLGENITKVFGTRRVWEAERRQNLKLSNVTILLWGADTALLRKCQHDEHHVGYETRAREIRQIRMFRELRT